MDISTSISMFICKAITYFTIFRLVAPPDELFSIFMPPEPAMIQWRLWALNDGNEWNWSISFPFTYLRRGLKIHQRRFL